MNVPSAIICFLWGAAATWFFFNAWLALIGVAADLIGWLRRRLGGAALGRLLFGHVTIGCLHALSLVLSFALCWVRLGLGRSRPEIGFFMAAAACAMAALLPTAPARIDAIARAAGLEEDDRPRD